VEDIHVELPPEKANMMRDALRIVTKIVQSLANNIQFGKEPHMAFLNDFLQANIMSVTKYLNDIYVRIEVAGKSRTDMILTQC
jgi:hypothetical protein